MASVKIIGLSGTNGSGKDAIGHLLAQNHNYMFISVTDVMRAELARRGLTSERENMRNLSAEWRREFGLSVLIDRAMEAYKAAGGAEVYAGVVMASLRNPYEADRIHDLDGTVVWADADPQIRYERLQNAKRQGRETDDGKTFEQFLADEEAEMHASGDAATLDMTAVKARADVILENNSSDLAILDAHVTRTLGLK